MTVYAAQYTPEMAKAIHDGFVQVNMTGDNHIMVEDQMDADDEGHREALAPQGIVFEVPEGKRLDSAAQNALRKIHCNLGRPSNDDLRRFTRQARAPQELVEAISWMKCFACARTQRPRTHRSTRMPPHDIQFNDQVMLDGFHLKDAKNKGHWFLSMLDRCTMYHQITRIDDHSPETFIEVFMDHWVKWAGRPIEVSIDMERGFGSDKFASALGEAGIQVVPIAGQAHWQHGKVERHGAIIKEMMAKVLVHGDVVGTNQVIWAANEVTNCKNSLVRERAWFFPGATCFWERAPVAW